MIYDMMYDMIWCS